MAASGAPFSWVPFADPRSRSTQMAPRRSMRACARDTPASFSTTSFSAPRPMLTRSPANRKRCPRPFPSRMVSANDTAQKLPSSNT